MKNINETIIIVLLLVWLFEAKAQTINQSCESISLSVVLGYQDDNVDYEPPLGYSKSMGVAAGSYMIWPALGNNCNTIKKPIIIVEGYDPNNEL